MNDHMSAAEYREYERTGKLPARMGAEPKPHKYGAKRTEYGGKIYPSRHEANRAAELVLMARAGEVVTVMEQVSFLLPGGHKYIADFVILWPDGHYTVEDAKGVKTPEYKIKRDLMLEKYGIEIQEV